MKIIALENIIFNNQNQATNTIACYPDSSIIRNNDDFFIPNFSKNIRAYFGIYLSFSKIGKHIEPQFAHRYYKEFGVAINYIAEDTCNELLKMNKPTDIARGFDQSFAISNVQLKIQDFPIETTPIIFTINNSNFEFTIEKSLVAINNAIAEASQYFTFKIGDFFFIPCICMSDFMKQTDECNIFVNQNHMLCSRIR